MTEVGRTEVSDGVNLSEGGAVSTVSFFSAKANSLTSQLLDSLATTIAKAGSSAETSVVLLRSEGETFCAGASFDELKSIETVDVAQKFFFGFGKVLLAIRACPKPVVVRVQGKAVGGGVGLIAAADYSIASPEASFRLSELSIGIGPYVIAPAIERRIGSASLSALAFDGEWRYAEWGHVRGLFSQICPNRAALETSVAKIVDDLSRRRKEALFSLKRALWEGTAAWDELLWERARKSAELLIAGRETKQPGESQSLG